MRPKIGVLARVVNKFGEIDVYLGPMNGSPDFENNIRVPVGTHVFVVKTVKEDDGKRVPLVSCEYGVGWLFWDELQRVDEVQAG